MVGKMSALNLTLRALVAGVTLSFFSLLLLPDDLRAAETQTFKGSVHRNDRRDSFPLSVEGPSTIRATLKWKKPQVPLKLYLKRPNGTRALSKTGGVKPKSFSRYVNIPGTWRVVVKGKSATSYNLKVTVEPDSSPPSPPPPPPPPPGDPCEGVAISPSMDVQAVMDSEPPGTTFCFKAGTYHLAEPIVPDASDQLVADPGTVLDGGADGTSGIWGNGVITNVTVDGFTVQNFANEGDTYVGDAGIKAGSGWVITDCEVRNNARIGIRLGSGVVLRGNHIHHNGQLGVVGSSLAGGVWEGNEISYNNTADYDLGDAGGAKVMKSSDMTFRGNHVHHNYGNGLWADTDNIDFLYEDNIVEYNLGSGIFHEVSYAAVIRDNTVRYNAAIAKGKSIGYGSNIQISVSQNIDIYGNTVIGNSNGIGLHDIDRGSGAYGEYKVANVFVHHNIVKMAGASQTGLNGYRPEAFKASAKNRFEDNMYYVTKLSEDYWVWELQVHGWPGWRNEGQDSNGKLFTW
jgi:hypothetical protein